MPQRGKPEQPPPRSVGTESSKPRDDSSLKKLQRVFVGAFLLFVLLRFVASFFPKERLWGINYFAYLPMLGTVGLTLVAVACCVPGWGDRLARTISERKRRKKQTQRKNPATGQTLFALAGAILFALICFLLRVPFPFLGDGAYVLTQISRWFGLYGVSDSITLDWLLRSEPVTALTYAYSANFLYKTFGLDTVYAFWILGPVAGGLFVFLLWKYVRLIAEDRMFRMVAFVAMLSCAGTLLFFGYIEHYAFISVGILGYCYVGVRCLRQKNSIWTVTLVLMLCIALHYVAACLIPSWLLLVWHQYLGRQRPLRLKPLLLSIAVSGVILFGVYLLFFFVIWRDYSSGGGKFIALVERSGIGYTLFSTEHVIDIVNELFLTAPIGMLLLVIGLMCCWKELAWGKPEVLFLFAVAVYLLMMLVSLNTLLGMARDWDIFSVSGLAITLWAVHLWTGIWSERRYLFSVVTITGVGLTGLGAWIALNASEKMSSARYAGILTLDEHCIHRGSVEHGYENLRKYYSQRDMEQKEHETIQKLIQVTNGDPGEYSKLLMFVGSTNPRKYRESFLQALESLSHAVDDSTHTLTMKKDGSSLKGQTRSLYDVYARFLIVGSVYYNLDLQRKGELLKTSFPELPFGYEVLGWQYLVKKDYHLALMNFQQSYAMDTLRTNTLIGLGKTYLRLMEGKGAEGVESQSYASNALHFYEKALAIERKPWILIDGELGYLYLMFGEYAEAQEHFERYLEADNSSAYAQRVKVELSKLLKIK